VGLVGGNKACLEAAPCSTACWTGPASFVAPLGPVAPVAVVPGRMFACSAATWDGRFPPALEIDTGRQAVPAGSHTHSAC
jgi:hypothetical protein